MIKQIAFFFVTGLMIIYGLVFTLKHFGWPSITERKSKIIRAIRTGLSSTALVVGLMLLYFYWTSPETFWGQWTLITIIGAFFFFVIPILGVMIVTSFVQFSVWEKTEARMTARRRKIINEATKDDKKTK